VCNSKKLLVADAALSLKEQPHLISSGSVELFRQFKDEKRLKEQINTWRYYDEEDDLEYALIDYISNYSNLKVAFIT
jgi:hypothetical protein